MKLKIAQFIGLNTDQRAAQVISSVRDGENTFIAVLNLNCDDAFTKGRQALSELSDYYFDFEGTPSEKLKATFDSADSKFPEGEFSILTAAISGKILYLIGKGEVEAYLKRGDLKREESLSPLLSVGQPEELISGFLQEGDRILFSTKTLVDFLGDGLDSAASLPIDSFEQELSDQIGSSELENGGIAALSVEIENEVAPNEGGIPSLDVKEDEVFDQPSEPGMERNLNIGSILVQAFKKVLTRFPRSGRGRLVIAVVLIVVIAVGIGLKFKASKDAQTDAGFNQLFSQAKDQFSAAKGLASLNPAEAKTKLDLAKDSLNQALNLKPKDPEAQALKQQIEQDTSSILQESAVSDFPLFLDLDLVKKNFRASQMSLSNGKLLLLDTGVKSLVIVDIEKKSNQILAGSEQLGEAIFASLNGSLAFVYSKDKGIIRVDSANKKVTEVAKKDDGWGEIKDLYGFAGNVYLLDSKTATGSGQIWKYLPTPSGYSDKREYLAKNTKPDLSNVLRMQIESSIYILKGTGEILRFTRGEKDNFGLGGLPSAVKDPKSFFVSSDTEDLYLLDSGNSRLLILSKTGTYKSQISGDKFASATDLVVDEKGKKVYLLEGGKVYSVDLK